MRTLERLAEALEAKLVVGFERGGSLGDQTVPGKLQGRLAWRSATAEPLARSYPAGVGRMHRLDRFLVRVPPEHAFALAGDPRRFPEFIRSFGFP